ncbi:MFS transporter [Bradyrhizobium sp. CCBAU 51745]|uniref:MFS transporter n=1 Tax=Bradyrhizobium sp. CCBAU 51745 TaxID=1325099 RepID=UPI0023055645|nr:MFS transporter [Bradyrhizobium sp. CCBAU 51745]MDA9440349.1 MFS transporter [Bradyrhizobium sp. CCBAU 51745]
MSTSRSQAATSAAPSIPRVIATALIGSALEWYDFGLYGVTAALVFAPLFFPTFSPVAGTLAAFTTYAVGFLSRPLGGIIFSHYGDKVGRKPVLAATLMVMGVSTCLMGLLPTFDQIGIWAPIVLVVLRLIQGLGAGAEYGGAALLLAEQNPARRGFYGAFAASGVFVGIVLSLGVFSLVTADMSQATLLSWGWRVPYLLSVVVVGVGLYLRFAMPETPEFSRDVQERHAEASIPLWEVLRNHPKRVLLGMGTNLALVGYSYVVQTYVLAYITTNLGLSRNIGLIGVVMAAAIGVVTMPLFGALADRIGSRQVIMAGALGSAVFAFPFFWMLDTKDTGLIFLAIVIGLSLGVGSIFGPIAAFYSELFDTRIRYTGLVFAREVSGSVVGGFTPLIATSLVLWSGGKSWPVAVYMIVTVLIPLLCVYLARDLLEQRQPSFARGRAGAIPVSAAEG